jgi:hypothetical protein
MSGVRPHKFMGRPPFCSLRTELGREDDAGRCDESRLEQFVSKSDAEDKLDWLEAHGIRRLRVSYDIKKGFIIHSVKQIPPGSESRPE